MKTLVYKRTHKGGPDETGCFGIRDCMGRLEIVTSLRSLVELEAKPSPQGSAGKLIGLVSAHEKSHTVMVVVNW